MRYRALDSDDDYTFGVGGANFLIDSAAAVAQAILTRLRLLAGEWFLDTTEGTPYSTDVLGKNTDATRDIAIQQRILETQGVTSIESYSSYLDPETRAFTVAVSVMTQYSAEPITITTTL